MDTIIYSTTEFPDYKKTKNTYHLEVPFQTVTVIKTRVNESSIIIYRRKTNFSNKWIDKWEERNEGERREELDVDDTLYIDKQWNLKSPRHWDKFLTKEYT